MGCSVSGYRPFIGEPPKDGKFLARFDVCWHAVDSDLKRSVDAVVRFEDIRIRGNDDTTNRDIFSRYVSGVSPHSSVSA